MFRQIFPHVELLFAVFQSGNSSVSLASNALKECVIAIQAVRDEIDIIGSNYLLNLNSSSSTASNESDSIAAKEACDLVCNQLRNRFESTDYVQSFKLVNPSFFA